MELWVLESALEKLKILRKIGEKARGILLGHKRADSFIVEDILTLEKIELNSKDFISSLFSNTYFLGFFSFQGEGFENLPQYLYGSAILKISGEEIKGYFVELDKRNSPELKELPVLIFKGGGND